MPAGRRTGRGTRNAWRWRVRAVLGARIDFRFAGGFWAIAAGTETVLAEQRSIDDQIEWLDERTVLYGLPRADSMQDIDIWSLEVEPSAQPRLFIEHAGSPAVVR